MSCALYRSDPITPEQNHSLKNLPFSASDSKFKFNSKSRRQQRRRNPRGNTSAEAVQDDYPIIVHCHLCWDWVWQRPQQFISRLSRRHPVLFVETIGPDPQLVAPSVRFQPTPEHPNITRVRLQFPSWRWGQAAYVDRARRSLVQEALLGPLA